MAKTISTAFVESTINQVVSKRFVKKQQMQWTPRGAHTSYYKHGPKSLTTISRTSSAIGTRSFTLVPLDPRLLDALAKSG